MASRVWYEAKVACGRPGCPVVINIDSPDECELMADLAEAIKRHGETAHNDGPDVPVSDAGTMEP